MSYSVKKGQQEGELILQISGHQSICPFVQAIPMQGQYGGLQIMRLPCTSFCPHAQVTDTTWTMTCSGKDVTHALEEYKEAAPLISM